MKWLEGGKNLLEASWRNLKIDAMEIYGNNNSSEKLKKSVEIDFDVYFLRKFTSNKQIFTVEK